MARRRKKESSRKRSLLFEESPEESRQCRRLLSPVLCVDHPVTALSVPVDDTNLTWVSPQFNGLAVSHGKRRQARRRRDSAGKKLHGGTFNKENSHINNSRGVTGKKFPALDFVGDPAKTAPKLHHQKSSAAAELICTDCDDASTSLSKAKGGKGKETQHKLNPSNEGEADYGRRETVRKRRSSYRKSTYGRQRSSLAPSSSLCDDESNSSFPSPDLPVKLIKMKTLKRASQAPCLRTSQNDSQTDVGGIKIRTSRKSYDSDILLSPLETSNLSGLNGHSTPVLLGMKEQLPLRVALFAPSPSDEAFHNNSGSICHQGDLNSQKGGAHSGTPCSGGRNIPSDDQRTGDRRKETGVSSQRRHSQNSQWTSQRSTPRRSQRLRQKCTEALKYLQPGTPTNRRASVLCESGLNVLVQDTPESEYGLTRRQRQQMKIKQKT
ncbi:uncharacterized protein [Littorina saxatilis]|uniref:Uncharacterized protein n=1 Tax=Littorina saxatilis TaxID=31220 RepID=A0AAN9G8J3_9CAEN